MDFGTRRVFRTFEKRAYFGCHNSLYIFATPKFLRLQTSQSSCFSYIKTCKKIRFSEQADCCSATGFWGPKSFRDLARNRLLHSCDQCNCYGRTVLLGIVQSFLWNKTEDTSFTWLLKSSSVMELNVAPNCSRNASILQSTCSAL